MAKYIDLEADVTENFDIELSDKGSSEDTDKEGNE